MIKISNYNSSYVDYRQYKIAKLVSGYSYIFDLGFAKNQNKYLSNRHVVGIDINNSEKVPNNYHETVCADVMELSSIVNEKPDAIVCGELIEHLDSSFVLGGFVGHDRL